jgi:hypothetical protein
MMIEITTTEVQQHLDSEDRGQVLFSALEERVKADLERLAHNNPEMKMPCFGVVMAHLDVTYKLLRHRQRQFDAGNGETRPSAQQYRHSVDAQMSGTADLLYVVVDDGV